MDMNELPQPLVPADCDLRDFSYMPLEVARLRDSGCAVKLTGDEFRAAVLLWCAAWHQVPAGSLPDDDFELAALAGYGRFVEEFRYVRNGALYGWFKCSDGRLYHKVLSEKALESWQKKLEHRWALECDRIRKHNARHKTNHKLLSFSEWVKEGCPVGIRLDVTKTSTGCPTDVQRMSDGQPEDVQQMSTGRPVDFRSISISKDKGEVSEVKGDVRDMEENQIPNTLQNPERRTDKEHLQVPASFSLKPAAADAAAPRKARPAEEDDALQSACRAVWHAYSDAYKEHYGVHPVRNAKINAQVKQLVQRLGAEDAPQVAAWYVLHPGDFYVRKGHDFGMLLADAEKLRMEWATGRIITAGKARQMDRAGTTMAALAEVLAERGETL